MLSNRPDECNGFDIVIGNPPYVVVSVNYYPKYKWNTDLYKMFFELSINSLSKPCGIVTMITPKFYLLNKDDSSMRLYLMDNVDLLLLATCNPFDAVTENVITILRTIISTNEFVPYYDYDTISNTFIRHEDLDKDYCKTNKYNEMVFGLSKSIISILEKMLLSGKTLEKLTTSKRGAEVSKDYLRRNNSGLKTLIGQDLKKYTIIWNSTYLPITHKEYLRLNNFFDSELIYLRRVDSMLEASLSTQTHYGFNKNVYGIKRNRNCEYSVLFLLGCINSKAVNFYYKKRFSTKKTDTFPEIQTYLYEQLPIPSATSSQQKEIISLVDTILSKKKTNPQTDTSAEEKKIDKLVYELYRLEPEEIRIVEEQ